MAATIESIGGRAAARPRRGPDALWTAFPAGAFAVVVFGIPFVVFCIESILTNQGFSRATRPYTSENYHDVLTAGGFSKIVWASVIIGVLTTVVTVGLALALTYWLRYKAGRLTNIVLGTVIATMFASYLVRIYAWRTLLGSEGFINELLKSLHLTHHPVEFLLFNRAAVVIAETQLYLPLIVLVLYGGFRPIHPGYLEAARDLGLGAWGQWRRVILPLLAKPLVTASLLAFLFSSSDWVAPSFLGGSAGVMLGLQVKNYFTATGEWPLGAALAILMVAFYAVLYGAALLGLKLAGIGRLHWGS